MKRILWGSLIVLLLAACGTSKPDLSQATNTFNFTVNPAARNVKFAATPAGTITTQAENGNRVLVPGTDLSLESSAFTFLPGNVLAIDAVFKNVSNQTFTNLSFSRAASSDNVVGSAEPSVVTTLNPGASTGTLRFTVQHKGQPFTYAVEARATVGETGGADCTNPVNIPDDTLRQGIREELEKFEGAITCADMANLTEVYKTFDEVDNFVTITNLQGLQFATNLKSLYFNIPEVVDPNILAPLSNLENLKLLAINRIPEYDFEFSEVRLEPLSKLVSLEVLSLRTAVKNISPLSNLPNLRVLTLMDAAALADYSALQTLPNLRILNLSNAAFSSDKLTDIGFIEGLSLNRLDLSYNEISDIRPLSGLASLDELNLSSNQISDLGSLSGLEGLSTLNLSSNFIRDLAPLVENTGLGNNEDAIDLSDNCLDTSQALSDVKTIEDRNPNVQNVMLGTQRGEGNCVAPPPPPPAEDCTNPVIIPDDGLRGLIRNAVGRFQGDITCEDMAKLTQLENSGFYEDGSSDIKSLEGLQFATNLSILRLNYYSITDLSPLSGLTKLTQLNLYESSISNISPLSSLTNLTSLELGVNGIRDTSPLSSLTKLTSLGLDANGLKDISGLRSLTNLTSLSLNANYYLEDIGPLSNLTNLDSLSLYYNQISDLTPLASLTNLTTLDLSENRISDLTPLANLTNLTTLNLRTGLGDNRVSDLTPLAGLTNLTTLDLRSNQVSELGPLANLTNLDEIDLSGNAITDIGPLAANRQLGEGNDKIRLESNPFDFSAGSKFLTDVETIENRNPDQINVFY